MRSGAVRDDPIGLDLLCHLEHRDRALGAHCFVRSIIKHCERVHSSMDLGCACTVEHERGTWLAGLELVAINCGSFAHAKQLALPELTPLGDLVRTALIVGCAAVAVPSLTVTSTSAFRFTLSPIVPSFPASVVSSLAEPETVDTAVAAISPVVAVLIVFKSAAVAELADRVITSSPSPLMPLEA